MNNSDTEIDWSKTSWEGSRREQLRQWQKLSLRDRLRAVEEMGELARHFGDLRAHGRLRNPEKVSAGDFADNTERATHVRETGSVYSSEASVHEIILHGCTPEPLMGYLKALGVLRLVSEQVDSSARGFWRGDEFVLESKFNQADLEDFFTGPYSKDEKYYRPSPIIVPWSGNDFFSVRENREFEKTKKTPTGSAIIEAFLSCKSERLADYGQIIKAALSALKELGIEKKTQIEKSHIKAGYIAYLRNHAPESLAVWIDAAAILTKEKASFSVLLGSGGGSDGNTHFSDNYMQNLWDVLPDFDGQRSSEKREASKGQDSETSSVSRHWLKGALFGESVRNLIDKRTSSIFDAGAVGGPNATQGMERKAALNPWNFILTLEGAICFAGTLSKRASTAGQSSSSFPFQVRLSASNNNRTTGKETAGKEIWLPLWNKSSTFFEIQQLLSQGRIEVGGKIAARGVDAARAVASLGVDRGISAFQRYAIVKGRVGGDNYNTAASMGRFEVKAQQHVDLLCEIDNWLYGFRRACNIGSKEEAPARFTSALRNIDSAIFDYCRYGGHAHFQAILITLGRAERELMRDGQWAQKNKVPPLYGLSSKWIDASRDGSPEYELALALAGIRRRGKVGSLRGNLEPVYSGQRKNGTGFTTWAEKDRAVVWSQADLGNNLAAVLSRRMQDAARHGNTCLPLWSAQSAPLDAIAAFLAGQTDDNRLEDLLWGLILVDHSRRNETRIQAVALPDSPPLPRIYALLKLLFLPAPVTSQAKHWRYARQNEQGIAIKPEPRILPLLRAGRTNEAIDIAARRLTVSGLHPMIARGEQGWNQMQSRRLAAALLFPINPRALDRLLHLVVRKNSTATQLQGEPA